jgi:acetylornithine deacetylase/succinyl-diaminopimelate desuccinylase-like protein
MAIYEQPAQLLQHLLRFDTTNPPGNEAECLHFIQETLATTGIAATLVAKDEHRPNLVARLPGRGSAAPLLLQGHVDVVTTAHQDWHYPPFEAVEADGYIWGRGALDMKGGVAMMLAAFLRAQAENTSLSGDVILTLLSDEEVGSHYGARYLVEEHAHLFEGVRYALGEFGGFTMHLAGRLFYPIQVLEKQCSAIEVTLHGPGGHGSLPLHGGAMAKLGHLLHTLDTHRLPVHIVPTVQQMVTGIASALPEPFQSLFFQLLDPTKTDDILDTLGAAGTLLDALLHNTVNATIVQGGAQLNVIPGQVILKMDGRLLPGFTPQVLLAELQALLGEEPELRITYFDQGSAQADMGLYETLATILREQDPAGVPIPYVMPAVTDGRFFSRLGIQTYGFLPLRLPADFSFLSTIHAADERIPVEAVNAGAHAIFKVLQRFPG